MQWPLFPFQSLMYLALIVFQFPFNVFVGLISLACQWGCESLSRWISKCFGVNHLLELGSGGRSNVLFITSIQLKFHLCSILDDVYLMFVFVRWFISGESQNVCLKVVYYLSRLLFFHHQISSVSVYFAVHMWVLLVASSLLRRYIKFDVKILRWNCCRSVGCDLDKKKLDYQCNLVASIIICYC